ncbi:MAG: hypothetical protein QF632_07025 [Candidatus Woesearchaeota archaeon]|jgi:hypothetical protein|nr:hypothetical protein [Candidatus Woesearchaeota archaeon]MDP7324487.1 hypothetical protein [Candidatus Woesearchaeota archaeon]MDP7458319.1 hypothetical protein [Candidatus Woesearchaeota archaeon]
MNCFINVINFSKKYRDITTHNHEAVRFEKKYGSCVLVEGFVDEIYNASLCRGAGIVGRNLIRGDSIEIKIWEGSENVNGVERLHLRMPFMLFPDEVIKQRDRVTVYGLGSSGPEDSRNYQIIGISNDTTHKGYHWNGLPCIPITQERIHMF